MAAAAALNRLLPLVLLAAVVGRHGASGDGGFPIVFTETKCTPAPTWSRANDSAYRANVRALLGGLPSAAAPTGFASTDRSGGAGRDRAFARGICFGDPPPALSPQYCLRCLSVAAKELADGCPAKRRAAVWTDGCFASFADTSALSPDEAAFHYKIAVGALVEDDESSARFTATLAALAERLAPRAAANASRMLATATVDVPRVVAGSSRTVQVHSLAQCMPDRPAASCARCVQESARELGKCCWNMHSGGVATVIGYNCHLRLDVSVPMTPQFDRSRHRECDCLRHSDDLPDALNNYWIRSAKEEEASPPAGNNKLTNCWLIVLIVKYVLQIDNAGHVRGNVAAVKAAQIVPTQYADQRIAV
uniref:Gnk2-homologous domain-containing protein n=1 Tax=Oryza rufipogon TaxID=4529 RepID=A0A0E0NTI6_ORYRU